MFPFVEGAYLTLNNAFNWGEKHGVGIWLDFHAHNGSQNGCGAFTGCQTGASDPR